MTELNVVVLDGLNFSLYLFYESLDVIATALVNAEHRFKHHRYIHW